MYVKYFFCFFSAADVQKERDDRIRAESKAASLERQVNVLQLDLKNLNQKLARIEQDYQASQIKVCCCFQMFIISQFYQCYIIL